MVSYRICFFLCKATYKSTYFTKTYS